VTRVVSLTVHRNTLRRRRERQTSKDLVSDAKRLTRHKDVAGYVVVSWNQDQDCDVEFVRSDNVSSNALPEFVRGALRRKISMMDNE